LPAHIYISAMNSNDTASCLTMALCVYIFLIAIERKLTVRLLFLLSACMTAAIFTKYTALAVIPAVMITLCAMTRKRAQVLAVTFVLPLACLGFYCAANLKVYGSALPSNHLINDPGMIQPKAEKVDYLDFRPWAAAEDVVLKPGLIGSFWTQLYAKSWFDFEPKFLYFTDPDDSLWTRYYEWLRGEAAFPAENKGFSLFTRLSAMGLMALGLVPLFLMLAGCAQSGSWTGRTLFFPVLIVMNLAIVVFLTLESPVYSSMKAVYLLGSLPSAAALIGFGAMRLEKHIAARRFITVSFALLSVLVIAHVMHIVWSVGIFSL
jgi:hypothetical protein